MMLKYVIALAVLIVLAAAFAWAFLPARNLPGNRARHLRIRLHLRLHPGKGFAHVFSLWLRWSRFAVLRRSGQIRPALPHRYSLLDPGEQLLVLCGNGRLDRHVGTDLSHRCAGSGEVWQGATNLASKAAESGT